MKTTWFGEVWQGDKLLSNREDFAPRDNPRQAYEDAVSWAAANLQHPEQATCYGVNVESDADFFDEESFCWLTLYGEEADVTLSHVETFSVRDGEIVAVTEDGEEVPLTQVGGLLSRYKSFLCPVNGDDAWDKAAILAEDYSRELKAAV